MSSSSEPLAVHVPVMVREVLQQLALSPGLTVVDGTVGAAGHSKLIAERIGPTGKLIGLDRDSMMLNFAKQNLAHHSATLRQSSYVDLPVVLEELGIERVDRILLDLGLSSDQLADDQRGFSFQSDGPLDLRFDTSQGVSAAEWLRTVEESELQRVLHEYGEEPFASRIAAAVVQSRASKPIRTAHELADLVMRAIPAHRSATQEKHPATRVFQALRIVVNRELEHVERAVNQVLPKCLTVGGRLAVITFHSLEDRIIKQAFRDSKIWEPITEKPIAPTPAEQRFNPRSRSAKLRVAALKTLK